MQAKTIRARMGAGSNSQRVCRIEDLTDKIFQRPSGRGMKLGRGPVVAPKAARPPATLHRPPDGKSKIKQSFHNRAFS
ncbi:MAG: hypothetical protein HY774_19745 [Acidobacteria bacterium]|nr:hypothetical protein [Acidobacteriota bacterium]